MAFGANRSILAVLSGPDESPAGDADGQGVASVMLGVSGKFVSPFSRAIDRYADPCAYSRRNAGVASGPIRVTLTTPAATGVAGTFSSSGCVAGQDTAVLARLRAIPSNFYINVHNGPFPGGAIRGQLF